MKVLVACEKSGEVREAFKAMGHYAMSCDLQDTDIPGEHYKGDVFDIINNGWDMMLAFPPCTHLAVSGAAWFEQKRKDGRQQEGIDFFMKFTKTNIPKVCIENPVGIMSKIYRKPDQIIQPYYFGDDERKTTCLWLKKLPKLIHIKERDLFNYEITHVEPFLITSKTGNVYTRIHAMGSGHSNERSKTFPGIAKAMAEQWG